MAKKKKDENYLDRVPLKNPAFCWGAHAETGIVTITVPNRGVFDRIVQVLFHKPAHSLIDLDVYGSFVWKHIDGANTVYDIAKAVTEQFGNGAEPLYNRLVAFIQTLKAHRFVLMDTGATRNAGDAGK